SDYGVASLGGVSGAKPLMRLVHPIVLGKRYRCAGTGARGSNRSTCPSRATSATVENRRLMKCGGFRSVSGGISFGIAPLKYRQKGGGAPAPPAHTPRAWLRDGD